MNNILFILIGILIAVVIFTLLAYLKFRQAIVKENGEKTFDYIKNHSYLDYEKDLKCGKALAKNTKALIDNFGKGELKGKTEKQIYGKLQRYTRKFYRR